MTDVFEIKEPHYNLRSEASHFKTEEVKSTYYGIQSVQYLGPKMWNIVPQNVREFHSLNVLEKNYKNYIAQVGSV